MIAVPYEGDGGLARTALCLISLAAAWNVTPYPELFAIAMCNAEKIMQTYAERRLSEIKSNPSLVSSAPVVKPDGRKAKEPVQFQSSGKMGFVYFITQGNRVKIGFTTNLEGRLSGLQTGSHETLTMQASLLSFYEAERMIHRRFKADRIRGEWFNLTDEIEEFWDDLLDYQGMNSAGETGNEFIANMVDVFVPLEALAIMLDTINEPWPMTLPMSGAR